MSGPKSLLPSPLTVPMATGSSVSTDGDRDSLTSPTPPQTPPHYFTWQRKVEVPWGILAGDGKWEGLNCELNCAARGRVSEQGWKMSHYAPSALQSAPLVTRCAHTLMSSQCDLDTVLTGPLLLKAHLTPRVVISGDLCADDIAAAILLTLQQGALYVEGALQGGRSVVAMMSSAARAEDPWICFFLFLLFFFVTRNTTVSKDTFHYTQKLWEVGGGVCRG